jgi:hypothetical protein
VSVAGDAANVINPYSHVPVYRQLADILRKQIESGEFGHLDVLPSEKALVQTYGVGRDNVRSATGLACVSDDRYHRYMAMIAPGAEVSGWSSPLLRRCSGRWAIPPG